MSVHLGTFCATLCRRLCPFLAQLLRSLLPSYPPNFAEPRKQRRALPPELVHEIVQCTGWMKCALVAFQQHSSFSSTNAIHSTATTTFVAFAVERTTRLEKRANLQRAALERRQSELKVKFLEGLVGNRDLDANALNFVGQGDFSCGADRRTNCYIAVFPNTILFCTRYFLHDGVIVFSPFWRKNADLCLGHDVSRPNEFIFIEDTFFVSPKVRFQLQMGHALSLKLLICALAQCPPTLLRLELGQRTLFLAITQSLCTRIRRRHTISVHSKSSFKRY